jgi:hypothetical protein
MSLNSTLTLQSISNGYEIDTFGYKPYNHVKKTIFARDLHKQLKTEKINLKIAHYTCSCLRGLAPRMERSSNEGKRSLPEPTFLLLVPAYAGTLMKK